MIDNLIHDEPARAVIVEMFRCWSADLTDLFRNRSWTELRAAMRALALLAESLEFAEASKPVSSPS